MSTKVEQKIDTQTFTIGILETKFISFEMTEYAKKNKVPIAFDKYEFTLEFNMQIVPDEKKLSVVFASKLFHKQEQSLNVELASLKMSSVFGIINFDDVMRYDTTIGKYLIPNQLLHLCAANVLGSARGMYSVNLSNTLYSNSVIPLIDATTLIPKEQQL